jgi:hypothetical protein
MMEKTLNRYETREELLVAALGFLQSEHHFNAHGPSATEDAEMEYKEEILLESAREFVKAHEGIKTAKQIYLESHR